jgi:hypothetical protein
MTTAKVALTVPVQVLRLARKEVKAGHAKSLSSFVSEAIDEKLRRTELLEVLDAMDTEHGRPNQKAKAWAKCMEIHMKTALTIDDQVMSRLKQEAPKQGRTMSELVEVALRRLVDERPSRKRLPRLPGFDGGGQLVDVADREALYGVMEGR